MDWSCNSLAQAGFAGFVPFSDLPEACVPQEAGVYVVLRVEGSAPTFRGTNPAGRFKGKDPSWCLLHPLDSLTWRAAMAVAGCDPARVRQLGLKRFTRGVAKELPRWGGQRVCHRIVGALHAAATDTQGVPSQRPGALERAGFALTDLHHAQTQRDQAASLMVAILDELDLTQLATSIPGLSAVGAAAILAETGDLTRFDSARAVVKHAGLCPRENSSGTYAGKSTISGRGRPLLRVAAWRAVWGALGHNEVLAARHAHLTTREHNKLTDAQARVAVAASLLRQLFVVLTTRTAWDPAIAAGRAPHPDTGVVDHAA